MPKLTDTQLVILSSAAQRGDGAVQPLPKSLKLQGGALACTLKSLLKKSMLAEQAATRDATAWRETPDGARLMLIITDAGRQALGVELDQESNKQPTTPKALPSARRSRDKRKASSSKASHKARATHSGTKQSLLIDLLSHESLLRRCWWYPKLAD